jgi:hypothetical protein
MRRIQIFGIYANFMTFPYAPVIADLRLLIGYRIEWQHGKREEKFS